MVATMAVERSGTKKSGGRKKIPTTTTKVHVPFLDVVGQLAKLKGTSIPDELTRYQNAFEDDLLTELAKRQAAIEKSRRE